MSDIKIKMGSEKDCVQTITVELPVARVKEKIGQAFENVRSHVKMPGFRPGKAPIEMVRENFKDTAYAKAQDYLLNEGVAEALKEKKINPIQSPVVESMQFDPEKAFQFEFRVEVAPVFKPTSYKGLKINRPVKPVTDGDVDKALGEIASMNARLVESKDEALDSAHFAVVDYEGSLNGAPMDGAKADNFLIDMSAPQTIAGLAEGLKGAKTGETREIPVKFPEDSPAKELAGKEAVFKVKLNAIKTKQVPAMDDEFAKDVGMESLAELKKKIRENIEKERQDSMKRDMERQIIEHLLEENKFSLPQSLVDKQLDHLINRQRERMTRQGIAKEDQDKLVDGMKAEAKVQAEKDVRLAYILNAVADAEKIEATVDEVKARVDDILQRSDPKERERMAKAIQSMHLDRIQSEIRESKLFDWLIANAKVKEVPGGS